MSVFAALPAALSDAALELAAAGVPVFPCRRDDKRPLVSQGFKAASTDAVEVRGWWARMRGALIGMPTGAASGFWVLDIDTKGGEPPDDILQALQMEFGDFDAPVVRTPSGGLHVYFRADARIRINGSGKTWRPQIDWRGEGGYVCVPPSENGAAAYRLMQDGEIADAPPALVAQIIAAQGGPRLGVAGGTGSLQYRQTVSELIQKIKSGQDWHANTNILIARLTAEHGIKPEVWGEMAPLFQRNGYSLEQTVTEIYTSAAGAYAKFAPAEKKRAANEGGTPVWPDATAKGEPRGTYQNARAALLALGAEFGFDMFRQRSIINWPAGGVSGEAGDDTAALMRQAIVDRFAFDPKRENVQDAMHVLCLENSYDPVLDAISAIRWDGKPRLDTWLSYYLGAEDSDLVRAIGRKALIAAVRRLRQPGCKFDSVLVLEGQQGAGKSSALRIIAGSDEAFTDQDMLHLDSKAQQEALAGKWIIELAELAGMRRTDSEKIKAFASRTHDRARGAFARFSKDQPRRCILVGTTNDDDYLNDSTGNRRFWPVRIGSIALDDLKIDRDQLLAEAAHYERGGESLVLPEDLWGDAASEAAHRLARDPWEEILADVRPEDETAGDQRISTSKLLGVCLSIAAERQTQAGAKRLAAVMRKLGWEGPLVVKINQSSVRGYRRTCNPVTGGG